MSVWSMFAYNICPWVYTEAVQSVFQGFWSLWYCINPNSLIANLCRSYFKRKKGYKKKNQCMNSCVSGINRIICQKWFLFIISIYFLEGRSKHITYHHANSGDFGLFSPSSFNQGRYMYTHGMIKCPLKVIKARI